MPSIKRSGKKKERKTFLSLHTNEGIYFSIAVLQSYSFEKNMKDLHIAGLR
jgi:hypothetical protein